MGGRDKPDLLIVRWPSGPGPEGFFVLEAGVMEQQDYGTAHCEDEAARRNDYLPDGVRLIAFARILDEAGVDVLLVGDSMGCVVQATNTLAVTMDEMLYHTRAVARGRSALWSSATCRFFLIQVSKEEALRNAGGFLQEGGAEAVKLEGGVSVRDAIAAMVDAGIPVMGHRADAAVGASIRRLQDPGREKGQHEIVCVMLWPSRRPARSPLYLKGCQRLWQRKSPNA